MSKTKHVVLCTIASLFLLNLFHSNDPFISGNHKDTNIINKDNNQKNEIQLKIKEDLKIKIDKVDEQFQMLEKMRNEIINNNN